MSENNSSQWVRWLEMICLCFASMYVTYRTIDAYQVSRAASSPLVVLNMKLLLEEGVSRTCISADELIGGISARIVQLTEAVVQNPSTQAVLIVFDKSMPGVSLAMTNQFNQCIKRMRQAGKVVYVHTCYEFLSDMKNWAAIASAGIIYSEIPERNAGFGMQSPIRVVTALGKRFEYLLSIPQVFRSIDTPKKNAGNELVTDTPSEEIAEEIAARLEVMSNRTKLMIIEGFPALSRTVVDRFEQAIEISPAELLSLSMVQNKSLNALVEDLTTLYGAKGVGYVAYLGAQDAVVARRPKIAVISVHGSVGESLHHEWVQRCIKRAESDPSISVVVLDVDGPGGSSYVSGLITDSLERLKAAGKKIVASAGGIVCGSADYQIASFGDRFFASKTCLVGSIGVLMSAIINDALEKEAGEMMELVGKSPNYALLLRQSVHDPVARAELQGAVERAYRDFCTLVAKNRRMTLAQVRKVATGEVYPAEEALRLGLIDQVGDLHDAIEYARKLTGDPSALVALYQKPFRATGWRLLKNVLFG